MTFKQLHEANATIRTTPIHGKEYAEVNQRIKAFRMVFPNGFIMTQIISLEDGVCVFRAEVGYYDENSRPIIIGTGTAFEKQSSSKLNATSFIENAETSAVGRALGMAGFGIDTSVASAEEVENAIDQQEQKVEDIHVNALRELLTQKGVKETAILKRYKLDDLANMTMVDFIQCCNGLSEMEDKA